MKMIRIGLVIGLAAAAAVPGWAEEKEAVKKDMDQLQGEWSMVSSSADGQSMPAPIVRKMKRVCKGDEVTTTIGGQVYFKARISIDPSKTPKAMNYQMTEGVTKGQEQLGIYEVEGDTFKSSFGKPGAERPADFTSKPGDGRTVSVWRRNKPAAAPEPGQK